MSAVKWKVKEEGTEENWATPVSSENQQNEPNILAVCVCIYLISDFKSSKEFTFFLL